MHALVPKPTLKTRPLILGVATFLIVATGGIALVSGGGEKGGDSVHQDGSTLILDVGGTSGYELRLDRTSFAMTTARAGTTVLASPAGSGASPSGAVRFMVGDTWHRAAGIRTWDWDGTTLTLAVATDSPDYGLAATIRPAADRYAMRWSVTGTTKVAELGLVYDLSSAGHWYGQGEAAGPPPAPYEGQPWPLDSGRVVDPGMNPSEYLMTDPFWFTESAAGLLIDTRGTMDVAVNDHRDGLGRFYLKHSPTMDATVFVEPTPKAVYDDYIGIVGGPRKSDATKVQFTEPLWNTWGEFYTSVDQAKVLAYAQGLAGAGLAGHAIQIDDGWMPHYGDLAFDPRKFPDPLALSQQIHGLGFDLGLWVTLWINTDSTNFQIAKQNGYFLADKQHPTQPCLIHWWNGTAGIVDLGDPAARTWFLGKLHGLMASYGVDGFKFDTRFFDGRCAPAKGYEPLDYLRLGAQLAARFDLQGVGVRISWGSQRYGFVTREVDKCTDLRSLQAAVTQAMAISTIGYPFVETDMIGGSNSCPPPTKGTLVRWAQAAALMPIMYSAVTPLGVTNPDTGDSQAYDKQTVALYRAAIGRHMDLAPYIWERVQDTLSSGRPIMQPLFFDFPGEPVTYTITDEWLLGDTVLAAPVLAEGVTRDVYLPGATWLDVTTCKKITGPAMLKGYDAPLDVAPAFVRLDTPQSAAAVKALAGHRC